MSQKRQSREEKRCSTEAMALGLALQDALRDLVQANGADYLDTFLERQLQTVVDEMRCDTGVKIPDVRATQRSTADDAEAALRREIDTVRLNLFSSRKAAAFA
jgi:type III secretory pathway component EscV